MRGSIPEDDAEQFPVEEVLGAGLLTAGRAPLRRRRRARRRLRRGSGAQGRGRRARRGATRTDRDRRRDGADVDISARRLDSSNWNWGNVLFPGGRILRDSRILRDLRRPPASLAHHRDRGEREQQDRGDPHHPRHPVVARLGHRRGARRDRHRRRRHRHRHQAVGRHHLRLEHRRRFLDERPRDREHDAFVEAGGAGVAHDALARLGARPVAEVAPLELAQHRCRHLRGAGDLFQRQPRRASRAAHVRDRELAGAGLGLARFLLPRAEQAAHARAQIRRGEAIQRVGEPVDRRKRRQVNRAERARDDQPQPAARAKLR